MVGGLETDGTLPAANLPVRGDCHTGKKASMTLENGSSSHVCHRPLLPEAALLGDGGVGQFHSFVSNHRGDTLSA